MNKLTIPAILVATILVAGFFAFSPIETATTVHTAIIAEVQSSTVLADDSLTSAKIATDAITSDELATSAIVEIGTLDRQFHWDILDQTAGGVQDLILIPAVVDKDIEGRVTLTSYDNIAARNCVIESTDGATTIVQTTDNTVETVSAAFDTSANTPPGFGPGKWSHASINANNV